MELSIRRAEGKDIDAVMNLLSQVLEIHAALRPDLFISGTTKYTKDELLEIFSDDDTPVFVAEDKCGRIFGYAFCVMEEYSKTSNTYEYKSVYIDDLCVDENARGHHVGKILFDYVKKFAKERGCSSVNLNVWEGNDNARAFYDRMGMKVKKTNMELIL